MILRNEYYSMSILRWYYDDYPSINLIHFVLPYLQYKVTRMVLTTNAVASLSVNLCLVFWDLDLRQQAGKESAVVTYYCKWMEQPGVSGWISLPLDIRMGLWEGPEPQYNERRKPQLPWQLHKYTETISTLSNIK